MWRNSGSRSIQLALSSASLLCLSWLVGCGSESSTLSTLPIPSSAPEISAVAELVDAPIDPFSGLDLGSSSESFTSLVTPIQTDLLLPYGVAFDGENHVVAEFGTRPSTARLRVIPADGSPSTILAAGQIGRPRGVLVDEGNYIVTDSVGGNLYRVTPTGEVTQITTGSNAGQLGFPFGVAQDGPNRYIVTDFIGGRLLRVDATTGAITPLDIPEGALGNPYDVVVQTQGLGIAPIYVVSDLTGKRLLTVTEVSLPLTNISIFEVANITLLGASFDQPRSLTIQQGPLVVDSIIVTDHGSTLGAGRLLQVPLVGGLDTPITVSVIEDQGLGNPTGIAISGIGVYTVASFSAGQLTEVQD